MVGLVTCKNEEGPSKNEGTRVVTISLWGFFLDAQGQLTLKSLVRSCRISNPFEILLKFLLPARIKKNKSKNERARVVTNFPYYNPMGAMQPIPHPNDVSDEI